MNLFVKPNFIAGSVLLGVAVAGVMFVSRQMSSVSEDLSTVPTTLASAKPTTLNVPAVTQKTGPMTGSRDDIYAYTVQGMLNPAVVGIPERVYVPDGQRNTLSVIDPKTFKIIATYHVGRMPQHIVPSFDLKTLYVTNDVGDTLTPIDPKTGKTGTPIPVIAPYNLYFTPDGQNAIVVAETKRRLDF